MILNNLITAGKLSFLAFGSIGCLLTPYQVINLATSFWIWNDSFIIGLTFYKMSAFSWESDKLYFSQSKAELNVLDLHWDKGCSIDTLDNCKMLMGLQNIHWTGMKSWTGSFVLSIKIFCVILPSQMVLFCRTEILDLDFRISLEMIKSS